MQTRHAVVAGQFYPAQRQACLEQIRTCLAARTLPEALPESIVAAIVPHAGWTFSGDLAALAFSALHHRHEQIETFVLFGTAHGYFGSLPAVDTSEAWQTPLGTARIDAHLRDELLGQNLVVSDDAAHQYEHSIEVQVPFIQYLFRTAAIVPIIVPPNPIAVRLGQAVAALAQEAKHKIVAIGSTDLTHYGPRYGFTPVGAGAEATRWAHAVNDRAFIDAALRVEPQRLLSTALEKVSACGPGPAAAAASMAKAAGRTEGHLLAQTDSNEVMRDKMGTSSHDSVGYAAIVF